MRNRLFSSGCLILMMCMLSVLIPAKTMALSVASSQGRGGKVLTPIGSGDDYAKDLVVQPDGRIVVVGYAHNGIDNDFVLVRYLSDGSLDPSFGQGGRVITNWGRNDLALGVALQPDGKILAVGITKTEGTSYGAWAVARYQTDGTLDATFSGDGLVTTDLGWSHDWGHAIAVHADGRIVAAGERDDGSPPDFAAARYLADGSLDTAFSGDGIAYNPVGAGSDEVEDMVLQSDGKIIVTGVAQMGSTGNDFALVRFGSDGTLDLTFDGDGKVTTDLGTLFDRSFGAALQADGRIVLAGVSRTGNVDDDFAITRYNCDGSLDPFFGAGGKATFDLGSSTIETAQDVAIQADGKIVTAGYSNGKMAALRQNGDGSLDTTFGQSGYALIDFGCGNDYGDAVAVQADGKIVIAGYASNGANADLAVVRLNSDGSLDSGFGNAEDSFVYVCGTNFMLNGDTFSFGGTNAYYLNRDITDTFVIDRAFELAEKMNLQVIRIWGFLSDSGFDKLDYAVEKARAHGIKLILVLTNNWSDFEDSQTEMDDLVSTHGLPYHHDFFTDGEVRADYVDWITRIVSEYKDEPTIMAWELANEPRCQGDKLPSLEYYCSATDTVVADIKAWADDVAGVIQSLDSRHLVAIGDEGHFYRSGETDAEYKGYYGIDFEALLALPSIDFGTFHLYPESWAKTVSLQQSAVCLSPFLDWGTKWICDHLASASALGKPVILEEFGLEVEAVRDPMYKLWTDVVRNESGNGFLFWMLGDDGVGGDDGMWIYASDPVSQTLSLAAASMLSLQEPLLDSLFSQSVFVMTGQTQTVTVTMPDSQVDAIFTVRWAGSTVGVTLVEPGGREITPQIAELDSDMYQLTGNVFEFYRIRSPEQGEWKIVLYGADLGPEGENVSVDVVSQTGWTSYLPLILRQ